MATDLSVYEGTDKTWGVTITNSAGTAIDITGYTFLFVVKETIDDTDSEALIKKVITSHTDPTSGKTQIVVDADDTSGKDGKYMYDFQWLDTSSDKRVVLKKAEFQVEQRIGDSFS